MKTTVPHCSNIVPRLRLFSLLDSCRPAIPLTWIAGPAGSGKTSLVASYLRSVGVPATWYQVDSGDRDIASFFYHLSQAVPTPSSGRNRPLPLLTPEYQQDIPTFTRRFFELLFSRMTADSVLVLDDYHLTPADSALHHVLCEALSTLPKGSGIFIISREMPLPQFSRFSTGQQLKILGWNDLRLTFEETEQIVRVRRPEASSQGWSAELHQAADGWAAGLIALIQGITAHGMSPLVRNGDVSQEIFDYFAGELFEKLDERLQGLLLKTAFLPKVDAAAASELTGLHDAGDLLSMMSRAGSFTSEYLHPERVYEYHPLFRAFLKALAGKTLPAGQLREIQRTCATLLETAGRIEDAAALLIELDAWERVVQLILVHAPELMAQGRHRTVEKWLCSLPETALSANGWLLYWHGVALLCVDPGSSRASLEDAFARFTKDKDTSGQLLAWSSIVDSYLYGWDEFDPLDRWISWLDGSGGTAYDVSAPEIGFAVLASMAGALIARKPDHPRISQWMHRTEELVYGELNPDLRLRAGIYVTTFNLWMGRYGTSGRIAETIRRIAASADATPLTVISWKWVEAATETFCEMAPEKGLNAVEAGLEIARTSGVHMLDFMLYAQGVTASLSQGDLVAAKTFLDEMTKVVKGKNARSAYHFFSAWHACLAGNFTSGLSHAEQSLKDAIASGMPCAEALVQVAVADLLFIRGERRMAWEHLKAACRIAEPAQSSSLLFLIHLTTAWLHLSDGDGKDDPLPSLRQAMAIGRAQGLKNSYWWNSPRMTRLCLLALENGIEIDYVRDLIRARGLAPDAPPYGCAAWPWPLRIRTLGRFAIYRDEQEVRFPSKAPRQILLVLKVLVAAGPQGATEEHLADLLWPDAPGDAALKSLATSLHRLRQLLGTHESILLRDGRLTVNPKCCFVDTHAFEILVAQAELNRSGPGHPGLTGRAGETDRLLERALSLYQGRFLEDVPAAWATSTRERMQARYVRAVLFKGSRLQAQGRLDDAFLCYEQGIERAELAEPLHLRLITCHLEKGRRAEALMSHNRFAQLLSSSLGLGPSDEMRALLKRIRDDDLQPSSS